MGYFGTGCLGNCSTVKGANHYLNRLINDVEAMLSNEHIYLYKFEQETYWQQLTKINMSMSMTHCWPSPIRITTVVSA